MDRAAIRAALLLRGFTRFNSIRYGGPYLFILVDTTQDWGFIRVGIFPRWIIGVGTIYGTKNFISATKAWRYINTLLIGDRP